MQVITVTGNAGRDAEVRQAGSGTVCGFSLAASEKGRNGGEEVVTWYRVNVWGRRGEGIAPYIRKGTRVTVTGRLALKLYTGNDGQARIDADIDADEIDFFNTERIDTPRPAQVNPQQAPAYQAQGGMYDEDIPF